MCLNRPVAAINVPDTQKLLQLLREAEGNHNYFSTPCTPEKRVTMANLFQTRIHFCVMGCLQADISDICLPTTTIELGNDLRAKTTQNIARFDIYDLNIVTHPFFTASLGRLFNLDNIYGPVPARAGDNANDDVALNVRESFEAVLADMRIHDGVTRAGFNVPSQFRNGFSIVLKIYGLAMDQKKGSY
ncbi:ATP-dependent DNA helicase II subunit 1 [Ceratobasidium sp. 395]|nr:ATP-dependent DNA helicase II subunit 1 [Ceratobasidium sp. 395]